MKSNRYIHGFKGKKKVIGAHDQWVMKKSMLKNVRDEIIHFVKYQRWNNSFYKMLGMKKFILWNMRDYELVLYKIWFDNFALKKWLRARHVVDSDKKWVENLSRDQI